MKDTKQIIIHTTMNLFRKIGYEKTTIAEICKACNITKGTFYYYFESKDDICIAYHEMIQDQIDTILPELLMMDDPREQLWKVMEYGIHNSMALGPKLLKAFFLSEMQKGLQQFGVYNLRTIDSFSNEMNALSLAKSFVIKGQALGKIKPGNPENMIYTFHSACMAMAFDWASNDGTFDEQNEMKKYFDVIF